MRTRANRIAALPLVRDEARDRRAVAYSRDVRVDGALDSGRGGAELGGQGAEHVEFACSAELDEPAELPTDVCDVREQGFRVLIRLEYDADLLLVVEVPVVPQRAPFTLGDL